MPHKKITSFLLSLFFCFLCAETVLRVQNLLGPIYDLEFKNITINTSFESEVLNHTPINFEDIIYDTNGIQIPKFRSKDFHQPGGLTVLFLGDSFMAGANQKYNVPQIAWETLSESSLSFVNAGTYSYSPSIFIPQLKKLFPIVKPDYLVIAIDETDLGDDYYRYQNLIKKNTDGKIIAVNASPLYKIFNGGFLEIKKSPLYLSRFFQKVYHTYFRMPPLERKFGNVPLQLAISKDTSPDTREKYAEAIRYFEGTVGELLDAATEFLGDPSKILILHHPHLGQLKADVNGQYWNQIVHETLQRVTQNKKTAYYDLTEDMRAQFGYHPEDYYFPGDMHFNLKGYAQYGKLVAEKFSFFLHKNDRAASYH